MSSTRYPVEYISQFNFVQFLYWEVALTQKKRFLMNNTDYWNQTQSTQLPLNRGHWSLLKFVFQSVVERVEYKWAGPTQTVARRCAWIDSQVFGFSRAIRAFGYERFRKNCSQMVSWRCLSTWEHLLIEFIGEGPVFPVSTGLRIPNGRY